MKEKMLIWMTEMKDEYVLEASCYKPRKSERRMLEQRAGETGNAKEIKAKKEEVKKINDYHRKGGRIMMYVGMGLGAAAAAAAIWVGSIFWGTDPDQPVKLPVTLERTTEEYTTEEETTEEETSIEETDMSLGSVIPSEKADTSVGMKIPIEDGKRLLIAAGEDTLVALDNEGNITSRLEHARMECMDGMPYEEKAWVLSADHPIAVVVLEKGEEGEEERKSGLYSLAEDRWLLEPEYGWLGSLSGSVWTRKEIPGSCIGDMIKADGTVINETYGEFFRSGYYIFDDKKNEIYDLDGNLLSHYEGGLIEIRGTNVIGERGEETTCHDVFGNLIWTQDKSLTYQGRYMEYLNWIDSNGAGIITDMRLNRILDDVQFQQINEDKGSVGRTVQMIAESPDGDRKIVQA